MLQAVRRKLATHPEVKALYAGEDHAVSLVGSCLVLIARSEPGSNILSEAPRWVDELLVGYPSKGGFLGLIQANADPPSEEGRKRIDFAYNTYGKGVVAGAMVIEGRGFVSASIRSALSMLMLTKKYPYPMKTFAEVHEGAAFLVSKLTGPSFMKSAALISGVESFREAYESEVGRFTAGGRAARAG